MKWAQAIADALKQEEVNVWFNRYELNVGDSITEKIDNAVSASDYFLALISSHSVNSSWLQQELASTLSSDFARRDIL